MPKLVRSALFKRQLLDITTDYRVRGGEQISLRFVDQIDAMISFIVSRPLACAVYTRIGGRDFRKWSLNGFPISLFFRIDADGTVVLEARYAHRRNISVRLNEDIV